MVYALCPDSVCGEPGRTWTFDPLIKGSSNPFFGSLRLHMIAVTENGPEILTTV